MEALRNTRWNRLFHTKEVKANVELKDRLQQFVLRAPGLISKIGEVTYQEGKVDSVEVTGAISLYNILSLHKEVWDAGFQNENLGPSPYGMFRTKSIPTMKPEEVYLGDIWGLYTKNIPFWEKYKNEEKTGGGFPIFEYLTVYLIILGQYKRLLSSNVQAIAKEAEKELKELERLGY